MRIQSTIYIFVLLFFGSFTFAQTMYSHLDKDKLSLGEPAIYKIRIENLGAKPIQISPRNELLPFHFEVIRDSINQQVDMYERTIEFAVYEEGTFSIPKFDIRVGDQILSTVPYQVEVVNSAKKEDQINDIMNNKEVKLDIQDYWQMYKLYILAALIVIALIIFTYLLIRYGKKRKSAPVVTTNQTLKKLDALKKKGYIENGNYRAFYVDLIEISRDFLTQQYQIPANVLLTDDLIAYMKSKDFISQEADAVVEDVFVRGDLVKFAKTFPDSATMEKDWNDIRAMVKNSIKDVELENLRKDV